MLASNSGINIELMQCDTVTIAEGALAIYQFNDNSSFISQIFFASIPSEVRVLIEYIISSSGC